jgi:hypothetical protein
MLTFRKWSRSVHSAFRELLHTVSGAAIALACLGCPAEDGAPSAAGSGAAGMNGEQPDAGPPPPDDDGPFASLDDRPCPDGELGALSYESFGAPFFLSYCQGCHGSARAEGQRQGAPRAISFDDVAAIRQHASRIWARAADQNATMPPVGGPGVLERQKLGAWLACGATARAEL